MTVYLQGKPHDHAPTGVEYIATGKNAFSMLYEPRREPVLSEEEKKRLYMRKKKAEQYQRRKALQVNRDTYAPTTLADREKTARISGQHLHLGRTL